MQRKLALLEAGKLMTCSECGFQTCSEPTLQQHLELQHGHPGPGGR
jgi:hypothetical protein